MPKLSILTPHKDQPGHDPAWIEEYIKSLALQVSQDFELVVAGDCVDEWDLALKYLPQVLLVPHTNSTLADAVTAAAIVAEGEYISVLASNDILDPLYVHSGIHALNSEPDAAYWVPNNTELSADILENSTMCSAFMVRREIWDMLGGFIQSPDGASGMEDWAFWMRMYKCGYKGIVDDRELWHWRRHDDTSLSGLLLGSELMQRKIAWMKEQIKL